MVPKEIHRDVYRGDTFEQVITLTKSGFTWPSVSVAAVLKTDVGGTTVNTFTPTTAVATNTLTITLTDSDTSDWTLGKLFLDVQVTATGYGPQTIIKLIINVLGDIS